MRNAKKVQQRSWMSIVGGLGVLIVLLAVIVGFPRPEAQAALHRAGTGNWTTYLNNSARDGYNASETIINPTTASTLKPRWVLPAGGAIASEPVLANGLVYWGSWDGAEHATNPTTGVDLWKVSGMGNVARCQVGTARGVTSTPSIASVMINGTLTSVDFVGGGDAQLYAIDALKGTVLWHTPLAAPPLHFIYGSPIVYKGNVYIGMSAFDDCPLVQGQMFEVSGSTGAILHTFTDVPSGCLGGDIWGSPTIDTVTGLIYFATGNEDSSCSTTETMTDSIIALHTSNLSVASWWQLPLAQTLQVDSDFGSTPTLFQATISGVVHQMVGLVNKNGIYYAFDRANLQAGPLWKTTLAQPGNSPDHGSGSIASSSWDGTNLYTAGANTTIKGVSCGGSVQALNPATGAPIWQVCFQKNILAPVISVPGLVVVGGGKSMYVLDSVAGKRLYSYTDNATNSRFWGAASISNGVLYMGNLDGNFYIFSLNGK